MQRVTELPTPPSRPPEGHKGTFGRVLIIAGSRGMSGAAILAGRGALRGGAGLVYVACPECIVATVAGYEPSYLTVPLRENRKGQLGKTAMSQLADLMPQMNVAALGPGCGTSVGVVRMVSTLYRDFMHPLVVDADGLNALALAGESLPEHAGPRILTPHPGEFSRLCGLSITEIQADREQTAFDFARRQQVVLVLKGPGSIVTDGERLYVNTTGNSGMATGGSGDVLTGLVAALLAQGMKAFDAAQLGVRLHGLAGDIAVRERSSPGLIAADLPDALCAAWRELPAPPASE